MKKKLAAALLGTTVLVLVVACGVDTETGGGSITPDTGTSSGSSGSSGTSSGSSGASSGSSGTSSGSSGSDAAPDVDAADAADAAPDVLDAADAADASPTGVTASQPAILQVDLASAADQGLTADGNTDGTIDATIVGPIDGLILITTDANGDPAGGQQWDTVVLGDALPNIGTGFTLGSETWILGVYDGPTLLNDADGRISLGAGVHNLTLVGSSSGFFVAGQAFRLYARDANTGLWIAGPTFTW